MTVTFKKMGYDEVPDKFRQAIISFTSKEIVIDETQLTQEEQIKGKEYLESRGYKLQV